MELIKKAGTKICGEITPFGRMHDGYDDKYNLTSVLSYLVSFLTSVSSLYIQNIEYEEHRQLFWPTSVTSEDKLY